MFCANVLPAQITVDSNGKVGLHSTTTSIACDVLLRGVAIIQNEYDGKLIFGNDYGTPQFYPGTNNTGKVGTMSSQFGEIRGQLHYATSTLLTSDKRLKENFRTIDKPLVKILQLNGKKYDYIPESSDTIGSAWDKEKKAKLKKDKLGFVAQEVLEILPEAVFYDKEADRYYIEYNAIIPVIVEAMKEQEAKIETLETAIAALKKSDNEKSATVKGTTTVASLAQNIPNPFSNNTSISMYLLTSVSRATLYIYSMQGEQIKQIAVNERENTAVTIEGRSLKAGMYLYSLIADGKEVDTKRMILTE
jgi:hypothetical protein